MQLFYTYFVLVSNANYCCLVYLSSSWCCFRANQMLACMSIQYVLCCSAINPFAFEIYITLFVCLFVASFICLPTLKELHCISHPLYELIVICPSSILHHKEQRKKISTTAFTLNQSSIGAKSFHLLWSLFFVWHIAFVSKEPKKAR